MPRYRLRIDGPAGKLETLVDDPAGARRGLALIAHPHPQHGGSLNNKVVSTLADTLLGLGYVAVRPNFRGVGLSEGEYDFGRGEVDDLLAVLGFVGQRFPDQALVLAGFSFGAAMQSQVCALAPPQRLLLVAPPINLFQMGTVPASTQVIHGERDELVPLDLVRQWCAEQGVQLSTIAEADHFFNRRLDALRDQVIACCPD